MEWQIWCLLEWLTGTWSPCQLDYLIAWKELAAIVIASLTWGHCWQRKCILFHSDNQAVVLYCQKSCSQSQARVSLLQTLLLFAAKGKFAVGLTHIPGINNCVADALSYSQVERFKQLVPSAQVTPTPIPREVRFL